MSLHLSSFVSRVLGLDVSYTDEDSSMWESEHWITFKNYGYLDNQNFSLIEELTPVLLRVKSFMVCYDRNMSTPMRSNFESAKKICIGTLHRKEGYIADSTLGVIVKQLKKRNFDIFKTGNRYYGNILEQARLCRRKILTLDIYFSCNFENVYVLTDG